MPGESDVVTAEVIGEGPSSTSDSPLTAEEQLKAEQAKEELRRLQLREVADLIPILRTTLEALIRRLEQTQEKLGKVLEQAMQLHEMMMKDAEAQFEITRAFQSTLIVLEEVQEAGTLGAAIQKATGKG